MKKILAIMLVFCISICGIKAQALETSAKAAILINGDTGEVIYQHNSAQKLPMASTTKIMTALLLCENGNFDREITVTAEMLRVEGSSMGLLAGDKVTLHDLLYGMLLASGNDAANVTAYVLGGTVNGFVQMMNEKAQEIGLKNTNFVTPSGLDADEHYTTAEDLAKLSRYAMQNEAFRQAVSSQSATLEYGNPPYKRSLTNHNKLLKTFDGAIGIKTGYTKKSGRCLVSAAKRDGKFVIAVTLSDPDDWGDHAKLLEYGLESITVTELLPEKTKYCLPVISSADQSLEIDISPFTVSSLQNDGFSCEVNLPQFLYAPVAEGEAIGSIVYRKNDEVIAQRDITANKEIPLEPQNKNFKQEFLENIKYIFMSIWEK